MVVTAPCAPPAAEQQLQRPARRRVEGARRRRQRGPACVTSRSAMTTLRSCPRLRCMRRQRRRRARSCLGRADRCRAPAATSEPPASCPATCRSRRWLPPASPTRVNGAVRLSAVNGCKLGRIERQHRGRVVRRAARRRAPRRRPAATSARRAAARLRAPRPASAPAPRASPPAPRRGRRSVAGARVHAAAAHVALLLLRASDAAFCDGGPAQLGARVVVGQRCNSGGSFRPSM